MINNTQVGPKALKDPQKRRRRFYILTDTILEPNAQLGGKPTQEIYLDEGRLAYNAKFVGGVEDENLLLKNGDVNCNLNRPLDFIQRSIFGEYLVPIDGLFVIISVLSGTYAFIFFKNSKKSTMYTESHKFTNFCYA